MQPGSHVSFSFQGKQRSGTIVTVGAKVVVKLDSGYNISVPKAALKGAQAAPVKRKKAKGTKPKQDPSLPRITILHTGGTIASKVDYATGAVIAQFTAEEILALVPELGGVANVSCSLLGNMQSEMMRFAHWNLMAEAVAAEAKKGVAGVLITHGTDTLHYSSAALAFALENIAIPVVLVGSQRSSDRPSSDATSNLLCAARFAATSGFQGVAICMHEGVANDDCVVLPALRSRKMHTSRRDAFRAINDAPYARISYPKLEVEQLRGYPKAGGKLTVTSFKEGLKVGLLHVHPQLWPEELKAYKAFDGLVLSLLGMGHAPTMKTDKHNAVNDTILKEIKALAKRLPVVGASQTIYGRVSQTVYSPMRQLAEAGVVGHDTDMTPETAFVKLAWLLSNKKDVGLFNENVRGEISARSDEDGFRP